MNRRFEYRVCRVVQCRITFVNDEWQGANIPEAQRQAKDVEFCPALVDYLQRAGKEGWDLVSAVQVSELLHLLYLKRRLPSPDHAS